MATEQAGGQSQPALKIHTAESVAPRALRQLLADSDLRWVYAESLTDTILAYTGDFLLGKDKDLLQWEHGRAFDETLELDWWRTGQAFRLRVLTEGDALDGVDWKGPEATLQPVQPAPYPLRLHGTYDKDSADTGRPTWSEARIPRHMAYPVKVGEGNPPDRAALRALDYTHAGCVVLTRLVEVARSDGAADVENREESAQ